MRAVQLELNNFCQHRQVSVPFSPGLTAIIGPNGSGKSNLIGAMKYALTGDIPVEGKKETNICQLADATESSFVSFEFVHGSAEATVIRYLRPDRASELHVNSEDTITGDRRINARIEELLGVDRKILDDIVMVDQGDIFGFLDQKPAKRADAFAKIFHIDHAETCWKALGEHIRSRAVAYQPIDCDAVREVIAGLEADVVRINGVIGADDDVVALQARYDAAWQASDQYSKKQEYGQQAEQTTLQITAIGASVDQVEQAIADNEGNVMTLQRAADGCADAAREAQNTLTSLAHITRLNQQKDALRLRIADLDELLVAAPPIQPAMYNQTSAERIAAAVDMQVGVVAGYTQLLASFDPEKGLAKCPTCSTPVDNIQDSLDDASRKLPVARSALVDLKSQGVAFAAYSRRFAQYERDKVRNQQLRDRDSAELDGLEATPSLPEETEEQLQCKVTDHAEYAAAIAEFAKVVTDARVQLSNLHGQVLQLQAQEVTATNQFNAISITQAEADAAAADVHRLVDRICEVNSANSELISVVASLELYRARLVDGEEVERVNAITSDWVGLLGPVRDLLHRESAPRFVSQRNLQRIQVVVNEHLERFDTDFRVRADEGLSFVARFNDGRYQPAERLSGGQKVVLALSFRLAVNFMYSDLGFLSLDEPTAYLDAHHIAGFEPVLNRLREYATSRGLQCIMVTHEQSLAHLFDSVNQL